MAWFDGTAVDCVFNTDVALEVGGRDEEHAIYMAGVLFVEVSVKKLFAVEVGAAEIAACLRRKWPRKVVGWFYSTFGI